MALHRGLRCWHAAASAFRQPSSTCRTAFPAQHLRPSGVLSCCPDGLELTPGFYPGSTSSTECLKRVRGSWRLCAIQIHAVSRRYACVCVCPVSGCANPEVPASTWFRRTADGGAVMGCQYSSDTASFSCVDNQWRGSFINCSERKHLLLTSYLLFHYHYERSVFVVKLDNLKLSIINQSIMYF